MDRYHGEAAACYREAAGAIVVFDLSSFATFRELASWVSEFAGASRPNSPVIVCGNKADLPDSREVENDEIMAFCNAHDGIPYFEVSASTGEGISQMMQCVVEMLPGEAALETASGAEVAESRGCWR
jgi:GTPase SAR1 family protein